MLMKAPHGTITDASPAETVRLRRLGWEPIAAEPDESTPTEGPIKPAESASKADWVAYASLLDLDVSGMSKTEIIEKLG